MEGRYNTRSPAVKRLMKEAQELREPTDQYFAQPLEDNLFEWHFTVRGPADSDFHHGIYHGRIILPVDYPMKPPSIIWLTPNGRFEVNKKICLSISGHHPESWQPSWSIRTALLAIIGFMPTQAGGAIGSLDYTPEERKTLAKKTRDWRCPTCGDINNVLLERTSKSSNKEANDLAAQINLQGEKTKSKDKECPIESAAVLAQATVVSSTASPSILSTSGANDNASSGSSPSISKNPQTPLNGSFPTNPPSPFTPWGYPANASPPSPHLFPWPFPPTMNVGHAESSGIAAMVPRFPLPPSYSSGQTPFYPPGFALPPGLGMFPCPMPPMAVSVNNSSYPSSFQQGFGLPGPRSPQPGPASSQQQQQGMDTTPPHSPQKTDVMKELLSKVKRVGSDEKEKEGTSEKNEKDNDLLLVGLNGGSRSSKEKESLEGAAGGAREDSAAGKNSELAHAALVAGDTVGVHDASINKPTDGHTDCEVSASLKKDSQNDQLTGADMSQSDFLPDDNSLAGALPLDSADADQRSRSSHFDRSLSSSVPDLDINKQKSGQQSKSLRQRQSALASVPTEVIEDLDEPQPASAGGQRIEAASGDNSTQNTRFLNQRTTQALVEARNQQLDPLAPTQNRREAFDTSFIVMVGLTLATIFILLNRLITTVDMSDYIQFD